MNRTRLDGYTVILLAVAVLLVNAPLRAEIIDRVLAVVSGQLIMLSDVSAARDLGLVSPDASARDPIGVEQPFDAVRAEIVRLVARDRRNTLIADWVAGLRRRGDIIDLYLPSR